MPSPVRAGRRRHAARASLAIAGGVLALVLAACGSSGTTTSSSTPSAASTQSAASTPSAAASQTVAASSDATTTTAAQAYPAGCHSVPPPTPRNESLPKPTKTLPPGKDYSVTLTTNCGRIVIALADAQAPVTASSFAYLVVHGFYNGLTFHRIVAGFVIQGGDPTGTGNGGPGYTVVESPPAGTKYTVGTVAMAKTSAQPSGASGSQFFIVIGSGATSLPPEYALVGHVSGSMAALNAIAKIPVSVGPSGEDSTPDLPAVISRASLVLVSHSSS